MKDDKDPNGRELWTLWACIVMVWFSTIVDGCEIRGLKERVQALEATVGKGEK